MYFMLCNIAFEEVVSVVKYLLGNKSFHGKNVDVTL